MALNLKKQRYLDEQWRSVYNLNANNIEKQYTGKVLTKSKFVAEYPFFIANTEIKIIALKSGFIPYAYATYNEEIKIVIWAVLGEVL